MEMPEFNTKKELFKFLVENKGTLIAQKKAELKKADAILIPQFKVQGSNKSIDDYKGRDEIKVNVIINTTNLFDSHKDVHLPGIWDKSLKENKNILHLQEHKMSFDSIISKDEDLKAYTKEYMWEELGYNSPGKTQALEFESTIKKGRNEYMFEQYAKGYVDQHSVGMIYVKLLLAVNSDYYPEEKEIWDNYINEVANKGDAEDSGYMWIVKQAKVIEGSAVPVGSNFVTPTLDIKSQPSKGTDNQPSKDTDEIITGIKDIFKQVKF